MAPKQSNLRPSEFPVLDWSEAKGFESLRTLFKGTDDNAQQAIDWMGITSPNIGYIAAMLGLDRFFGFSSAWMRYMTSAQRLQAVQSAFLDGTRVGALSGGSWQMAHVLASAREAVMQPRITAELCRIGRAGKWHFVCFLTA